MALQDLRHTAVEHEPEIVHRRQALLLQQRQGRGRLLPHPRRNLVAAHVQVAQRHAGALVGGHQFVDDFLDEGVSGLQRRVHHIVGEVLHRRVDGPILGFTQQVPSGARAVARRGQAPEPGVHRLDGCAGVAWHLDLGNDFDVAGGGVLQDFNVVLLGEVAAAKRSIDLWPRPIRRRQEVDGIQGVAPAGAHVREFGKAGDLEAPALIVGDMEVQRIELVPTHQVEHAQHGLLGLEVPCHVQVKPAVTEPGRIDHAHGWEHGAL